MKKTILLPLVATLLLGGCSTTRDGYGSLDDGWGDYDRGYYQQYGSYDWDRPDPRAGGYYADNYYRGDRRYC